MRMRDLQPELGDEQAGPCGVAERPVVVTTPGNAGESEGALVQGQRKTETRTKGLAMSLPTLPNVQKLQEALHVKAKRSPSFRFYSLYDKVYRADILYVAYRRCLINGGAAGVDGVAFEDIRAYGEQRWLDEGCLALLRRQSNRRGSKRLDGSQ